MFRAANGVWVYINSNYLLGFYGSQNAEDSAASSDIQNAHLSFRFKVFSDEKTVFGGLVDVLTNVEGEIAEVHSLNWKQRLSTLQTVQATSFLRVFREMAAKTRSFQHLAYLAAV